MREGRTLAAHMCAICERTLLVGERITRYAPMPGEFVDVCPLCQDIALEQGWVKEGSPTTPVAPPERRKRKLSLSSLIDGRRKAPEEQVASEPILRRLTEEELAMVEASELFNASPHRRTIGGIGKSLGEPRASIVPLSGVNTEVVITVAWDISWYQYRVLVDSAQPVRLEERGLDPGELDGLFTDWNARIGRDGRLLPQIPRV